MKTDLSIVSCIVAKSFKKITCFFKVIVYSSVVPSFHFIRVIHREAVKNCKGEKVDRLLKMRLKNILKSFLSCIEPRCFVLTVKSIRRF